MLAAMVAARIEAALRKEGPKYDAKAGEAIAGDLVRGDDGQFSSAKDSGGKKKQKGTAKPKGTPKADAAQREQDATNERQAKREPVYRDLGLDNDAQSAITALNEGGDNTKDGGLVERGLAERAEDGTYRLSSAGRAFVRASEHGDKGRARDIMSAARDATIHRQRAASAAASRKATAAKAKAEREAARAKLKAERDKKRKEKKMLFAEITKASDEGQIVVGIGSTPTIDQQPGVWDGKAYIGDVVAADAIKGALTEYMAWANIRAMHSNSAVGTALDATVADDRLYLSAHIVDEDAWKKVKAGVYKGFSIGGTCQEAHLEERDGALVRVITKLRLSEISLVDRPANPEAKILLWKGADMPSLTLASSVDAILSGAPGTDAAVIKAAGDPAKVVALIQALRNAAEVDGDMDAAELYTQGIRIVQQAAGNASAPAEDEADAEDEDTDLEAEEEAVGEDLDGDAEAGEDPAHQALVQRAAKAPLAKAGRMISSPNAQQMHTTIKSLAGMLAKAGDPLGQAILNVYGGDEAPATAKAIGAAVADVIAPLAKAQTDSQQSFVEALRIIAQRVDSLERQPLPGGPVLRQPGVQKVLTATPQPKIATEGERIALNELLRKMHTEPNAERRKDYERQYQALSEQFA